MRKLIKHILNESFLTEKAAPRKKYVTPKPVEKFTTSTGKWIHSSWIGDDGKFHIIWQDDVDRIDDLNAEIAETERIIERCREMMKYAHSRGGLGAGHMMMKAHQDKMNYERKLEKLKSELQSLAIDKPLTNYFDI